MRSPACHTCRSSVPPRHCHINPNLRLWRLWSMWSRQHSWSQSHLFALAGWSAMGLEHDRNFGFDHSEKSFGGTAQAAIGAVLVLLGVKWFDHVLLAGPRAGQYLRDVQSTGKTGGQDILRASCIESARLDLPIGAVGEVRPGHHGPCWAEVWQSPWPALPDYLNDLRRISKDWSRIAAIQAAFSDFLGRRPWPQGHSEMIFSLSTIDVGLVDFFSATAVDVQINLFWTPECCSGFGCKNTGASFCRAIAWISANWLRSTFCVRLLPKRCWDFITKSRCVVLFRTCGMQRPMSLIIRTTGGNSTTLSTCHLWLLRLTLFVLS